MKAETVLRNHIPSPKNEGEKNDDINIINAMQEYARIQIEKDRKRIIRSYYDENNFSDFNDLIKKTPINLD